MATPEQHAVLSASSSSRWLNCTKAPRLEEQFPESTSTYAEAGRVAHSIAELKARKYFLEPMSARTYNSRLKKLKEDPNYDKGMDAATDTYLEHLKSQAMSFGNTQPFIALETRVDFSDYAPEGFGTADSVMIGAGRICVDDYKNGSGVAVDAVDNTQMMLYALGALKTYGPIFGDSIQNVELSIIQPNAGGVKGWQLSRAELGHWGNEAVKPAAALAWAGEGDYVPGEHCRFCRARAQCSARAAQMLELGNEYQYRQPGALLSDDQVGEVLTKAMQLDTWVKDIKDYALGAALEGKAISGFKLVEGRGTRGWTDLDTAFAELGKRGVAEAMLWERKPVTPPALEKSMGKKEFGAVAEGLVVKTPGKPALVPESDPRKPYNAAAVAFA